MPPALHCCPLKYDAVATDGKLAVSLRSIVIIVCVLFVSSGMLLDKYRAHFPSFPAFCLSQHVTHRPRERVRPSATIKVSQIIALQFEVVDPCTTWFGTSLQDACAHCKTGNWRKEWLLRQTTAMQAAIMSVKIPTLVNTMETNSLIRPISQSHTLLLLLQLLLLDRFDLLAQPSQRNQQPNHPKPSSRRPYRRTTKTTRSSSMSAHLTQ